MRVLFVGSKDLGVEILRRMICVNRSELVGAITIDDRHDSRSAYDKFFEVCDQNGVPLTIAGARADSERAMLESHPDLCIVAGWYWLIGSPVLRSLKHGFIGLHFSLLPKYRGSSPLVWTLINGDVEAGFTFFSMTEAMDEGPVWAQGSVEVGPMDYVSDVLGRLQTESTKVFSNIYPKILRGEMLPTPQIGDPTYCASRVPSDGEVDWSQPAARIFNFIRAQSEPYPGAYTYRDGNKLVIWKARPDLTATYLGTPGQVASVDGDGVRVICGDDRAIVLECVESNGARLPAAEVIRSIKQRFPRKPGPPVLG